MPMTGTASPLDGILRLCMAAVATGAAALPTLPYPTASTDPARADEIARNCRREVITLSPFAADVVLSIEYEAAPMRQA